MALGRIWTKGASARSVRSLMPSPLIIRAAASPRPGASRKCYAAWCEPPKLTHQPNRRVDEMAIDGAIGRQAAADHHLRRLDDHPLGGVAPGQFDVHDPHAGKLHDRIGRVVSWAFDGVEDRNDARLA